MGLPANLQGWIARGLGVARPMTDGVASDPSGPRFGKYQEAIGLSLVPTKHVLADEGSYFSTTNPTPGTGVAYALQTTFSDTVGLFALFNGNKAGGKRIYLDTLRLILTAAPTATVSMEFAVKLEQVGASRLPTAGNAVRTPVNVNGDDSTVSQLQVQAFSGAGLTLPAAVSPVVIARPHISTSLGITGDEYAIQFGAADVQPSIQGLTAARATAVGRFATHAPPVVIAPQQWALIHMWWLTQATTAPSFEYELTHWER